MCGEKPGQPFTDREGTGGLCACVYMCVLSQAAVKALAWCPFQSNLLATGGGTADRCIKFWNTHTGAMLSSIDTGSQVCNLQWSRHEREILSSHGFSKNQLCLWKYPSLVKVGVQRAQSYTHRCARAHTYTHMGYLRISCVCGSIVAWSRWSTHYTHARSRVRTHACALTWVLQQESAVPVEVPQLGQVGLLWGTRAHTHTHTHTDTHTPYCTPYVNVRAHTHAHTYTCLRGATAAHAHMPQRASLVCVHACGDIAA